jgi:hydrogenase nickel incorporation protein HypB
VCTTCGCGSAEHDHDHHHHAGHHHDHRHEDQEAARTVRFERELLAKNAALAAANRRAAERDRITILNLIGSPGAGKTALLEALARSLRGDLTIAVLEGDQATDLDAKRIERAGCPVVQINTGAGCHLDASMIARGLASLAPPRGSVVLVENVGNLVCPALFDLGERAKVVVMSVTEGEDKPLKYPHVFRAARLLVVTKIDLLPHLAFDEARCLAHARAVAGPGLDVIRTSAVDGAGIAELALWIRHQAARAAVIEASP